MKFAHFSPLLGVAALLLAPFAADAQDDAAGVNLKPRYNPGYTYKSRQDQNMEMVMNIPGVADGVEQKVSSEFLITAVASAREDAPGGVRVATTIDGIKMAMNNPAMGLDMKYDSSDPADENSAFATQFKPMIGQEIVLLYDAEGSVEKVEGFEEFIKSAGGAQMFTEEQFTQMADPTAMMGFDDEPKKVGNKWKAAPVVNLGEMGTVTLAMDLHYVGDEDHAGNDCARLDMIGTAEMSLKIPAGEGADAGAAAAGGITTEESKIDGHYLIDAELGMLRKSLMNMEITLSIDAGGQQMTIPLVQTATFELLSVEETK